MQILLLYLNLPNYTLEEILASKVAFPYPDFKPIMYFKEYLRHGYYPFFYEDEYLLRLKGVLKQIVEVDIPMFANMQISSGNKLKKLLYVLAQSVPFKPNNAKLERDLQLNRNSLPAYFEYLEKAGLINLLREKTAGIKILEKVGKVYLNNPNIAYALSETAPEIGNLREIIFFALMRVKHSVFSSKIADFEIGGYTFEIGGKNKKHKQISNIPNAYIVKDDIEYAYMNTIPLWMVGFVY